jgi:hypothetical protein
MPQALEVSRFCSIECCFVLEGREGIQCMCFSKTVMSYICTSKLLLNPSKLLYRYKIIPLKLKAE